ncbi:capsid protein, partial [Agrobacterium tumefaciens]
MTEQTTTPAPMTVAPQLKAVPDTMTAAFDEFMEAFEAFRETNDQRLADIERKMGADVVTRDKLDRIDRALDDNRRLMDDLALKKARPALGRKDALSQDAEEHKAAFEAYIRRGEEAALRDLEAKAFAGSAGADGGFLLPTETDGEIGRRMTAISPVRALATVRQVSAAVLKKPFAAGGLATGWVSETAARPETATPKLSELSFPTMELYAMPAATQGLLDDAAVDI